MIPMVFAWIVRGRDICVWCERMSGCVLICFVSLFSGGRKMSHLKGILESHCCSQVLYVIPDQFPDILASRSAWWRASLTNTVASAHTEKQTNLLFKGVITFRGEAPHLRFSYTIPHS